MKLYSDRIMDEWRHAQGHRIANGNIEVLMALEFIARPLAAQVSPMPLRLSAANIRLAQQRAISQRRKADHGALPATNAIWWEQIEAIAHRWGITTTADEWKPQNRQQDAA